MARFHTIGHSNRTLDEFTELLEANGIELLVDVRKLAGSNKYPHFNADVLEDHLSGHAIGFDRYPPLAGRRPVSKQVPFEVNAWWQNRSFHNYADHALGQEFREGLASLIARGTTSNIAVMCSEAVWWRCHRRIIADHLLADGHEVLHILGPGQVKPAELSAGAVVAANRQVTYPAGT